jgi:hypothetical protein
VLLTLVVVGAWLSSLIVVIGAGVVGVNYYFRRNSKKGGLRSFCGFIFFLLLSGAVGLFLGFGFAIGVLCPLCGAKPAGCALGSVFIGGPLGFDIVAGIYFYFWARREALRSSAVVSLNS